MNRRALIAGGTVLAGLALWLWPREADEAPGLMVSPPPPATARRPAAPTRTPRIPLPRPALPTRTGSDPSAGAPPTPETHPRDPDGRPLPPPPRRYPTPVPPDFTAPAIQDTIRGSLDDITACLQDWGDADVLFTGRVTMGFALGPEGLGEVWIDDLEDVPAGPLTCLSSAIWEAPWPAFQDETTVRYPFELEVADDPQAD